MAHSMVAPLHMLLLEHFLQRQDTGCLYTSPAVDPNLPSFEGFYIHRHLA